jgi:hypothetical protein
MPGNVPWDVGLFIGFERPFGLAWIAVAEAETSQILQP